MSEIATSLARDQFRHRVAARLAAWTDTRGLDFGGGMPGVAPGNLWDPPSRWQDTSRRKPIRSAPSLLENHPAREELIESFRSPDYRTLNPDLAGTIGSDDDAFEHFVAHGYGARRPYNREIWEMVDPRFYAARYPGGRPALKNGDEPRRHYAYVGRFEDRFPNDLTEWVANTRVHLWQMGKVGSISIGEALFAATGEHAVHLHFVDAFHRGQPSLGVHYGRLLTQHGTMPKLVVCGVRDPVERVVSGYFQDLESRGRLSAAAALDAVLDQLPRRLPDDLVHVCSWFGHRFFCGLDVYAHPFDTTLGYTVIEHGPLRVFLYRQDSLPRLDAPLAAFLGVPTMSVPRSNSGPRKSYAGVLKAVGPLVSLPSEAAHAVYSTRYARHFFTPEEIELALTRIVEEP